MDADDFELKADITKQRQSSEPPSTTTANAQTRRRRRVRSAPPQSAKKTQFQPTVPIPFAMTIRENQKIKDRQILNQMIATNPEEGDQEEENLLVNFKAKPVPKHVFQPVFQKMVENQPKRFDQTKFI